MTKKTTTKAPTKKRKNSRSKGKGYERLVAKKLGEWWGEPFRSTPGSGALHWEKDNRVAGDIVPPVDSKFPFTVECKKREGWYFDAIINETGEIPEWWQQSVDDGKRVDREPILIFSKNRAPSYVMLKWKLFSKLNLDSEAYIKTRIVTAEASYDVGICNLEKLTALSTAAILEQFS